MTPPDFEGFGLDPRVLTTLAGLGFDSPTPIQAQAIRPLMEGRDVIGRARTGSGKTAAFGLPIIEKVCKPPADGAARGVRVLVLAPTRELAMQVTDALRSFAKALPIRVVTIYGGSSYRPQFEALSRGVPIVVGTPGRLIDHLERGSLDLGAAELIVIDEADEMLRMGFIDDVERLLAAAPQGRQVALFSATMPAQIRRIADAYLQDPLSLEVEASAGPTTEHINQRFVVVPDRFKLDALCRILRGEKREAALVFVRTRRDAATLAEALVTKGIAADSLHGDLAQTAREQVLRRLRADQIDCVVATDVAARGIDVQHISHVINVDLPEQDDSYAHRIGRTGRAGREGSAISFVTPKQIRRFHEMRRRLGARIAEMTPPSDAAIARSQRDQLWAEVQSGADQPPQAQAHALNWVEELVSSTDWSPEDIAAGALAKLAELGGLSLDTDLDDTPPGWSQPVAAPPRPSNDEMTELFLPVGHRQGIGPGDLVGALTNELGVPGNAIGRITIAERKSFVAVASDVARRLLEGTPVLQIRGKEAHIAQARTSSGPPSRRGKPRGGPPAGGPRSKPPRPKPAGPKPPGTPKKKKTKPKTGKKGKKKGPNKPGAKKPGPS